MSGLYDNMTGLNKISKTLRFELIPEPETLRYLESDGVLDQDQKRADDYLKLKKLMDDYYRKYIEDNLDSVELEGLDEYVEIHNIPNKTKEDSERFEKCQELLRKQIVTFLKSGDEFKMLFKAEMIDKLLPAFVENDDDKRLVESFHGFATMCTGFWENRKNVFSDEAKSTAISYRVVHENLPKFVSNMNLFENRVKSIVDGSIDASLLDIAEVEDVDEIFSIEYFSKTLNQSGIEAYNNILGGFSLEDKTKVQGINEIINHYNQENKDKRIGIMQPLYKQILSDRNSISFLADKFETDAEVLESVMVLYNDFLGNVLDEKEGIAAIIGNIDEYDKARIFIKNDSRLTDFSNKIFGEWSRIINAMNDEYDKLGIGTQKNREKYEEARKAYFKRMKSVSLSTIERLTGESTGSAIASILTDGIEAVNNAYSSARELFTLKYDDSRKLVTDGDSISLIKTLLDEMKKLESFILLFKGEGSEPEKDELFYGEYCSR